MRVCSFLPAATQIIYDLGFQDMLHGVTFECPPQELAEKTRIVRCTMEGKNLSRVEIDALFSNQGRESLYTVDEELLAEPDLIFTQDSCEVCQIDTKTTFSAISKLKSPSKIVSISPNNLEDVYQCAITIATEMGEKEIGNNYVRLLKARTQPRILNTLRQYQMPLKRVLLIEWPEPIYNCGHWIPFQIAQAGGIDMLSNPAGDSIVTPWSKVVRYNPEILVIAPCGFTSKRSMEELYLLSSKPKWKDLLAVKNQQVYIVDYELFTQPSISTIVDGIEVLASLFHPEIFLLPTRLQHKVINVPVEKSIAVF